MLRTLLRLALSVALPLLQALGRALKLRSGSNAANTHTLEDPDLPVRGGGGLVLWQQQQQHMPPIPLWGKVRITANQSPIAHVQICQPAPLHLGVAVRGEQPAGGRTRQVALIGRDMSLIVIVHGRHLLFTDTGTLRALSQHTVTNQSR